MKLRRRNFRKKDEPQNFWPSFTDMISTIALVLFFLMLLAYIQNIIIGQDWKQAQLEIESTKNKLSRLKDELQNVLAEVEEGKKALTLSEEKIDEQKMIIAESNRELGKLRSRLQGIALLRLDVLKKVKNSIESELGSTSRSGKELVSIGDNGNIMINEGLMFDSGSYKIKKSGTGLLDNLSDAFEKVLNDPQIRENIDAINIQGHTDDRSSGSYNRELSAKRATSVVNYLMSSNPALEKKYGKYFAASGYSEFRPIAKGTSALARAKNRRIEISVILKDAHIQKVIEDYLKESIERFPIEDDKES